MESRAASESSSDKTFYQDFAKNVTEQGMI
jgi:hypothetical protein